MLGTPWQRGGRTRAVGYDCLGIVVDWIKAAGLPIIDPCSTDPQEVMRSDFRANFLPVGLESADFGDVVRFKVGDEFHLGILLFDGLLQATQRNGVHVARLPHGIECKFYRHKAIAAMVEVAAQC